MSTSFRFLFCALLGLLLAGFAPPAAAQRVDWARKFQDGQRPRHGDTGQITTDRAGNTYVIGTFRDSLTIGSVTLRTGIVPAGTYCESVFIAKFDSTNAPLWVKQSYGNRPVTPGAIAVGFAIAVDALDNLYVTGQYIGPFRLDSDSLGAPGARDHGTFLANLNARTGATRWLRHMTTGLGNWGWGRAGISQLVTDGTGDCLLIGHNMNEDSLGELPLVKRDGYDPYVARIAANGRLRWLRQWQGQLRRGRTASFDLVIKDAVVDAGGNCVLVGGFGDTLTLDAGHTLYADTVRPANGYPNHFDAFVVKLDRAGRVTWVRQTYTPGSEGIGAVAVDLYGNILVNLRESSGAATMQFAGQTVRGSAIVKLNGGGGVVWVRDNVSTLDYGPMVTDDDGNLYLAGPMLGITKFTAAGVPTWPQYPPLGSTNFEPTTLRIDAARNLYACGGADGVGMLGGTPLSGFSYAVLARLSPRANLLTGQVFLDTNNNGRLDGAEDAFPRPVPINAGAGTTYQGNANNGFNVFVGLGAYDLSLWGVPAHYQLTTPPTGHYTGSFPGYGNRTDNLNFGLAAIPGQTDLRVTVTPYSAARPGRATHYRARVENIGTTTTPATTLTAQLDGVASYVGAQPPPATAAGRTLTWNVPALAPFGGFDVTFAANLPTNVPVGRALLTTASAAVAGDVSPANNADSTRQIVTGSLDPNDLTVNFSTLTPQQIAAGQVLDYVIQFQNMGTDTAFAVVIHDSLPAGLLQLGTLALVGQSHNCQWMLDGDGLLTLRFPGIELPQRAVDAVRSMGFVRFQVTPSAALAPGVLIPNQAHIIFDYNAPLATNQVTTLVQTPNGLVAAPGAAAWSLYPNPATTTDAVTLTADIATAGGATVRVLDALGRPVREQALTVSAGAWRHALAVRGLAPGLYVVRLTTPDGAGTSQRLVVRGQ